MQDKNIKDESLNPVHVEWHKDDSYFIVSRMNKISNVGSHLHHTIVFLTGGKEVLNFLSAQILYCWAVVAGLCYTGNMANVSNLKCSPQVWAESVQEWEELCIPSDTYFLMLWLWYRNGVQILTSFCSANCDWLETVLQGQTSSK